MATFNEKDDRQVVTMELGLNILSGTESKDLASRISECLERIRLGSDRLSFMNPSAEGYRDMVFADSDGNLKISIFPPALPEVDRRFDGDDGGLKPGARGAKRGLLQQVLQRTSVGDAIKANAVAFREIGSHLKQNMEGLKPIASVAKEYGVDSRIAIKHHQRSLFPVECEINGEFHKFEPSRGCARVLTGEKSFIKVRFANPRIQNPQIEGVPTHILDGTDCGSLIHMAGKKKFQLPSLSHIQSAILKILISAGYEFKVTAWDALGRDRESPGAADVEIMDSWDDLAKCAVVELQKYISDQSEGKS